MYKRNRIYITPELQAAMKTTKIILGGLGIGSVIAECALRIGFENLHIIDGDTVELSNLNRQNYTANDIGKPKAEALYERLKAINPNANITCTKVFLDEHNLAQYLSSADIAVNAIDFTSNAPLLFDELCHKKNIPVLHPYNLGYGGLVCVFTNESVQLKELSENYDAMEIKVVRYMLGQMKKYGYPMNELRRILEEYVNEQGNEQPPQLSIASWILAGLCTDLFLKITAKQDIAIFPEFYYLEGETTGLI